jgi:alkylated DNA nucleotide flippase Atl1
MTTFELIYEQVKKIPKGSVATLRPRLPEMAGTTAGRGWLVMRFM